MDQLLSILDYSEYLIPILFFGFAHIVDTKVHKVWEGVSYHPDGKIRIIHHYQWEACFLMISLLAILGVKMAHDPLLFYDGLCLYGISFVLMFGLFLFALDILDRNKVKMSAIPFYLSIVVYFYYVTTDIYYLKLKGPLTFTIGSQIFSKGFLFPLTGTICVLLIFFLKRWIDRKLFTPDVDASDIRANKSVYNSRYSSRIKKAEALFFILKYYKETNQPAKMHKWRRRAARDIPKEMKAVVECLAAE